MSYPPQQPGPQDPWGQQQRQQDYYGSIDQSQDFWRQVAAGTQPAPPPPPPKQSRAGAVAAVVAVAIVVVVAGGVVALLTFATPDSSDSAPPPATSTSRTASPSASESAGSFDVGGCVDISGDPENAMSDAVCGSSASDYEVVEVRPGENASACPNNFGKPWEGSTYCLVLDAEVGDCLTTFREDFWPLKVDCARAGTKDEVTKVVDIEDHLRVCVPEEGWYSFSDPRRTLCFDKIDAP